MHFLVKAYRADEGVLTLRIEAPDAEAARGIVGGQGFRVVAVEAAGRWRALRQREAPFAVLRFAQELRALLAAGLSLGESLSALARKAPPGERRRLIETLIRQLREGKALSAALRQFPAVFSPLFLALTAASEHTGDLDSALGRFIDYHQRLDAVRKRVGAALIYPALLVGVGGAVVLFLMIYVVPRFSRVYADLGGELPWMSYYLLAWGGFIDRHGLVALAAVGGGVLVLAVFLRRRKDAWRRLAARLLDARMLAPLRERWRDYVLARFYRTVGLLLQGGIPVVTALGMARELLGEAWRPALDWAVLEVRNGVALSEALERAQLAPPVASDLLRIGEKTGDMGEKMIRIADFQDEETARWADWFLRLFEPLLMLVMGLFIAFIVVLLYMPIFELAGSVQ